MKKTMKVMIPAAIAIMVAVAASNIRFEGGCACRAPLVIFGSILGCGESKQPETAVAAAKKEDPSVSDTTRDMQARIAAHKVTFVEIGSVNCIPCKMMQPIMREVEERFRGQVTIVFHDVWTPQGKEDAMKYGIRVIPTQVFLDSAGNEYFRHEGFFPKDELVAVLKMKGVR